MTSKRIEPGCLCVIKVGCNAGSVVTAIRLVSADEFINGFPAGHDGWLVSVDDLVGVYKEWGLLRIDGGDPDAAQEDCLDQEVDCHVSA
ncbi:hypothetical protein [Vreelandella glaciei]|uniref:hypothetical protein n=1 Tax=Vreelandella glaciei TaxID=186761 RepID=UPI0030023443